MKFSNMLDLSKSDQDIKLSSLFSGIRRVSYHPETTGYEEDKKGIEAQQMGFDTDQSMVPGDNSDIDARVIEEQVNSLTTIFQSELQSRAESMGYEEFTSLTSDKGKYWEGVRAFLDVIFESHSMEETMMEGPQSADIGISAPTEVI